MSNLKFKLKQLLERHDRAKLKHLRGRHNQLDHAWNRGMGGGAEISSSDYREIVKQTDIKIANGEISQQEGKLLIDSIRKKANARYDALIGASRGMGRNPRRRRASIQLLDSRLNTGQRRDTAWNRLDGFAQPQPLNINLTPTTTVPVTSAPVSPVITGNNILAPFTNNLQLNIPGRIVNPYAALAAIHDATYDTQAADYARFKPQRTRVTKTLSRLPFIRRQISEAQDSTQADRDGAETASKIVKSMSFRRSGNIGFLTGEINQLIKQYDSLANGMFKNSNFVKNQLVALQQRITAKKAELYAEQNALAAETRDNFKADTPSVIATPTITNLNSEQQAQVRSALNKISAMMDASQLRTSHGGPLQFEVKGEHLGPNGPLALHRANIVRDPTTNEIDWTQSGSEIIINLDAVDQATIESSVVHEFGHVLQTQAANDFINDHADYIYNRLAGEPLRFADDGTAFYEDLFTRTYSGAIGNNNSLRPLAGMPFEAVNQIARARGLGTAFPMEALSTGLEQYIMDPHGLMINDPDLFMHMESLLTGKSAAQRTAKRIADDAAAAAGATPATPTVPPGGGTTPVLPGGGTATVKHPAFDGTTNVNGISYTKADLSHPFTAPMVDVTDASGTVIGQRRAVPYIDEVDPASLHTDLSGNPALVNRLGNLQRAVDAEYAAAMKSTGEQRAIHMMRAARISARIFQKYPDIRALENALAFASDMEVSNLPAGHPLESMVNDINNYGSFWLYPFSTDPKGNKTADPIPNEIYQYGVPGFDLIDQFDIYESIPFINIPSFSGVQLYRDQDSINQTSFISDAEISATPLTGTPPASTSITTPLNPGMITPPVTPGTPVTPATIPLNPGMITPTTTPKTTPLSTINSTEMIDRYVGDAQATEFLVSPQFYPTGFGNNVGQYETMSYKRNSGAKATNVKGRRKAPYIDEVAFDALPDSLQNDPVTVAKLSLLQRRYDAALANAWAFARGSGDPAWRLEAARIAAEMFNLYPDARVLADAQKIMPKVNDFNVGDTESRELAKTVADYVNYWSSPTRYIPPAPDFGGYIKPASRVELPMPDSIKKFGMPGQNLSPRIQIYDHLTKNPDTQFKYGQGLPAGATSVLKDMADGRILPQTDSFVQDSEYDTTDVIKALPVQAAARSAGNAAKAIPDVSDSVKNILSTRPPVVAPATPSTTPATTPLTDTETTPTPKRTRKPKPADLVDKILPPEPMGTDEEMLTEGELLQGNTFSDKTPGVAGREAIAYAPDPKNIYRVRHRIVDLGDIKASNLLSGSVNPDYDPVLQPRDRERIASLAQTNALAKDLRPNILIRDQMQTATGSPIINADGMVLSGNGRVMALQLIQDDSLYPGRAAAYREEVLKRAESLGIDPAEIEGMKFPVVVRELAEDIDSVTFARDANAPSSALMSPIEEARIDARTVTPELIALIDPGDGENIDEALQSAAGRAFTRAFLALLPANARPAYLTKDGALNSNGLIRAKAAVFAATFNSAVGDELTTSLLDGTGDMKKIETGLAGALPALAKIAAEARKGNINPDMDPTNDLATAIVALGRILRMPGLQAFGRKQKVAAWLNQGDFTIPEGTEKLTPAARSLLEYIDTIATSPRKLRQFFNDLAQNIEAQKDGTGQESLFGGLGIAPMDLNDVVKATIAAQAPEPASAKPAPATPAPATPAPAATPPATTVTNVITPINSADDIPNETELRQQTINKTRDGMDLADLTDIPGVAATRTTPSPNLFPTYNGPQTPLENIVLSNLPVIENDSAISSTMPLLNGRPVWTTVKNKDLPSGVKFLDDSQTPTYEPFAFLPDVQYLFRTERGSTYAMNGSGQTIRNRSGKDHKDPGTGMQSTADAVYFADDQTSQAAFGRMQSGSRALDDANIPYHYSVLKKSDGSLILALITDGDYERYGETLPSGTIWSQIPVSAHPAVGSKPIEVKQGKEAHYGNDITEIVQRPGGPAYDYPGMAVPKPNTVSVPKSASNRAFPIPTDPLANTNRILTDSSSPETNTPAAVVVGNNGKEYPDSEVYRASDAFIKSGSKYDSELNFVDFDKLIAEAATPEQAEMVQDAKEQFLKMAQKIKDIDGYGFESRPVTTASAIKNIEKYSELVEEMIDALDEELSPKMLEIIARHVSDVIKKYGKTYNKEWSAGKKENNKRPSRQHALDENLSNATSGAYGYWSDLTEQYKRLANPAESAQSGSAINSAATINPKSPIETIIRTPKASFDAFDDESKEEINQLTQQWLNASTQEQNIDILKRLAQIYSSQALSKNITPTERYRLYSDTIQFQDAQIDAIAKSDLSETEKRKQTNRVQNNRDTTLGIQDVILESNPEASILPTDSNETPIVAPSLTPDATSITSDATSEDANNAFSDNPPTPVGQRLPLRSIIPNPQYSFDNFSDAAKQEISELTQQLASSQTQEQNIRILDRLEMIYSQRLFDNVSPAEKNALYNDLIQITDVMPNAVAASNMPETVKRRWLVMINKRRNEYREIQSNLAQQLRLI